MRMCRRQRGLLVKVTIGVLMIGTLFLLGYVSLTDRFTSFLQGMDWIRYDEAGIVPATLLGLVYSMEDFRNEAGVVPPYWGCENNACNISSVWGPCYAPNERIDWESQVQDNQERKPSYWHKQQRIQNSGDVAGYCRPGFLIIGAGKCGTRFVGNSLSLGRLVLCDVAHDCFLIEPQLFVSLYNGTSPSVASVGETDTLFQGRY